MKKIFCFISAVFLAFPALADLGGYEIENYKFNAVLKENNVLEVNETIDVDFSEARHGIYRYIPTEFYVSRSKESFNGNFNGLTSAEKKAIQEKGSVLYTYRAKINNVSVPGKEFSASQNGGNYEIKIGSADYKVYGKQTYEINYKVQIPDDRFSEGDLFYYSANGSGWNTRIRRFDFRIQFEKEMPADSKVNVFSGKFGSAENSADAEYIFSPKEISGHAENLSPNEAVTLRIELPEGYFENEATSGLPNSVLWILFILTSGISVLIIAAALQTHHEEPVQTVEFYPPEDVGSAEVGYIIDSSADTIDLLSLIPYFAEKGYLKITEIPKKNNPEKTDYLELKKIKLIESDAPKYQKTIFNGLFRNSDTCRMDELGESFGKRISEAKSELASIYRKEKSLYSGSDKKILSVVAATVFAAIFAGFNIASGISNMELFSVMIPFLFFGIILNASSYKRYFAGKAKKAVRAVFMALGFFATILISGKLAENAKLPEIASYIANVLAFAAICVCSRFHKMTEYNLEITGKLLGFREFIKLAEVPKLKELLSQNPEYFYDVLPYAMVFGLTENWAKQFTDLNIPEPEWYESSRHSQFSTVYFANRISRNLSSSFNHAQAEYSRAEAKRNESRSGGRGFSGGGAGGGGGGSW